MSRFLVLDADAGGLFVVVGHSRGGQAVVDHVAAWSDGDGAPLTPANATFLGHKLKELLKQAGVKPAPVLVCIGRDRVILKDVRHPPSPPAEEPAVVRFQAVRDLTEPPDEMVMDYAPVDAGSSGERRALVVFTRKPVVQAAKVLCEAAGLRLMAVTPRPFASAAAVRRAFATGTAPPPDDPTAALAVVTQWESGGEFTIVRGTEVAFTRSIPAHALIDERSMVTEVRRNLSVYDGQNPTATVQAVYVAEPEDPTAGWSGRIQTAVNVPVYPFDPLAGSAAGDRVPPMLRGRFVGPIGLLAARTSVSTLPINFATPRQPRTVRGPGRNKALFGALAAVLLIGLLGGLGLMQVNRKASAVALLRQDKAEHDARLGQVQLDMKRLAAADEFTNREVVVPDELYDFADRVPDVGKLSVFEFDLTALPPPKQTTRPASTGALAASAGGAPRPAVVAVVPKKEEKPPVSTLRAVLRTGNDALAQRVFDGLRTDRFYVNSKKEVGQATGSGAKGQQYTITAQVLHRDPAQYIRALDVKPPPKPAATAPASDGFENFGGLDP